MLVLPMFNVNPQIVKPTRTPTREEVSRPVKSTNSAAPSVIAAVEMTVSQ